MLRKITALFAALLLLVSLTGCMFIPSWKQIDVRYDASEIVSVELYHLTDSYSGRFNGSKIDQMEEDLDPIDTLDAENHEDFVKDLEKLVFTDHMIIVLAAMDPYYCYKGYTVKITYQNGDYDILSPIGQLYDSGDDYQESRWDCDEKKWERFIKDYFTVDGAEETTSAPAT